MGTAFPGKASSTNRRSLFKKKKGGNCEPRQGSYNQKVVPCLGRGSWKDNSIFPCHSLNLWNPASPQVNVAWTQMPTSWICTVPTPVENGSSDRAPPKKQPGDPARQQSWSHGKARSSSKAPLAGNTSSMADSTELTGLPLTTYAEPRRMLPGYLHLSRGLSTISRHKGNKNCDNSLRNRQKFPEKYYSGGIPTVRSGKPLVFCETHA